MKTKKTPQVEVLIIGGGQAGLAMSNCLTGCNISHVVIERGKIANRWRNESWDSLRLLTPNYQTRLPNWCYKGKDLNGYMSVQELISFLENYAKSFNSPIKTGVIVESVTQRTKGFQICTDAGTWEAKSIVIATGHCNTPFVPKFSKNLNSEYKQLI
ncbi:MAG: NAD(P)-binding domain-containing protein, partial [Flavobacteriales bacterium]|nr:NAD(P)-binding domain-containing protein [Flavobacteriales bacterium]